MQNELIRKKTLYYTIGYFTPSVYLLLLITLFFYTDLGVGKDSMTLFLIWGIPAVISLITSIFIIRRNLENNIPINKGVISLSLAQILSILGFFGAIIYMFF